MYIAAFLCKLGLHNFYLPFGHYILQIFMIYIILLIQRVYGFSFNIKYICILYPIMCDDKVIAFHVCKFWPGAKVMHSLGPLRFTAWPCAAI